MAATGVGMYPNVKPASDTELPTLEDKQDRELRLFEEEEAKGREIAAEVDALFNQLGLDDYEPDIKHSKGSERSESAQNIFSVEQTTSDIRKTKMELMYDHNKKLQGKRKSGVMSKQDWMKSLEYSMN